MESKAKLFGHPVHPMLIAFPLGLLATAVIFDVISFIGDNPIWTEMAFYLIAGGLIGGLAAAIFGLIDWIAIPRNTRAKYIGTLHGLGNVVVIALFAASWLMREPAPGSPGIPAYVYSFLGVMVLALTGWLGGELTDRLGVGVDDDAHLNSPSSLSGLPASGNRSASAGRTYPNVDRRTNTVPSYGGAERRTRTA